MSRLSYILTIIAVLLPGLTYSRELPESCHAVDSLRAELRDARTASDSTGTLCNLYDILPREQSTAIGDTLYHTAMRAGDQRTALDVIRNQANRRMRESDELERLTQWALACADSNDRRETLTFIRLMDNMRRARYSDSVERANSLQAYLEEIESAPNTDLYDHIALTHGVCLLLSDDTSSDILAAYMDSLDRMINRLPPTAYSLRNAYNVHAATIFASSRPEKSVAADMKVLADIAKLEKYYHDNGRIYRNYNTSYYTIYTRLLSNFAILSPSQVEEYYRKATGLLASDPAIRETYDKAPMAEIYHAMYHKDYRRALPLLTQVIDEPYAAPQRLRLLHYMMECAEALGYKETLLKASLNYADALRAELDERSGKSYRELQTAYAIYEMKHNLGVMELQRRESVAAMQRIIIAVSLCALAVLAIFVIVLFRQYRKNRQLAHNLSQTNHRLVTEGENLRKSKAELIRARDQAQKANNLKSDFIKNMSYEVKVPLQAITEYSHLIADCVANAPSTQSDTPPNQSARHLARFADLLELNSELLSTIINDVLRLSEIESNPLPVQAQVVQVKALCEATIASVRHRVTPGVTLSLDPDVPNADFFTDPIRLQQILNNLLTNAAKFTATGSIVLSYATGRDGKEMTFTVTDTGIGINPENKEKIFDRFVKLDRDSQGAGLGLTISRLLARHLGGDLWLDTSYKAGARFCLSLPGR